MIEVESAGIEPASKQVTTELSTGLVIVCFSRYQWPKTARDTLIIFIEKHYRCHSISMLTFMVPPYRSPSTRAIERHPASRPGRD